MDYGRLIYSTLSHLSFHHQMDDMDATPKRMVIHTHYHSPDRRRNMVLMHGWVKDDKEYRPITGQASLDLYEAGRMEMAYWKVGDKDIVLLHQRADRSNPKFDK